MLTKTKLFSNITRGLACLMAGFCATAVHAEIVDLQSDGALFRIDTNTLSLSGAPDGQIAHVLSLPGLDATTTDLVYSAMDARWTATTADATFNVRAEASEGVLTISVMTTREGILNWPVSAPSADVQYALCLTSALMGPNRVIC